MLRAIAISLACVLFTVGFTLTMVILAHVASTPNAWKAQWSLRKSPEYRELSMRCIPLQIGALACWALSIWLIVKFH